MSEAKFTPGPWAFIEGSAERRASSTVHKAGDKEFRIADVVTEWQNQSQRAEDIANARLIAAAPDLLAACETFLSEFEAFHADDNQLYPEILLTRASAVIIAAVAKAKGGDV